MIKTIQITDANEAVPHLDNERLLQLRKENQKLTAFLKDSAAYIRVAFRRGDRESMILSTLVHDIRGLANQEPCFLPRVHGYANWEKEKNKTPHER